MAPDNSSVPSKTCLISFTRANGLAPPVCPPAPAATAINPSTPASIAFPACLRDLKNELDKWLSTTYAKIPMIDQKHNEEEEKEWLLQNKQKMKLKVEKHRAFQLDINYLPNEDWWGSTID